MSDPTGDFTERTGEEFVAMLRAEAEHPEQFVGVVPCAIARDGELRQSAAWAAATVYVEEAGRNITVDDLMDCEDPGWLAALGAIRACHVARANAQKWGAVLRS